VPELKHTPGSGKYKSLDLQCCQNCRHMILEGDKPPYYAKKQIRVSAYRVCRGEWEWCGLTRKIRGKFIKETLEELAVNHVKKNCSTGLFFRGDKADGKRGLQCR